MTEKRICDSNFEKKYLGLTDDEAVVEEKNAVSGGEVKIQKTLQDVIDEYRWYMRDPEAELPEEIMEDLKKMGIE